MFTGRNNLGLKDPYTYKFKQNKDKADITVFMCGLHPVPCWCLNEHMWNSSHIEQLALEW